MLWQTKVAMKIISPREHHREISAQGKFQDEKQGTEERPQTEETPAEVLGDRLPGRRCRRRMNENRLFSEPLGSDPLSAWWLGLAPATLEFWVRFPNEMNQGRQAHPAVINTHPCVKVPGSSRGLVVGSCTSHPGVLGSIPKREEPGRENRRTLW
jgi:hypothetical protein